MTNMSFETDRHPWFDITHWSAVTQTRPIGKVSDKLLHTPQNDSEITPDPENLSDSIRAVLSSSQKRFLALNTTRYLLAPQSPLSRREGDTIEHPRSAEELVAPRRWR